MTRRKNTVLYFYTGLNTFVVVYLLVALAWRFDIFRSITDDVIPWFMVVGFLGIPPFAIFLWFFNRPVRKEYSGSERVYLLVSRLAAVCTWLCSCWLPLMIVAVFNPWFWPLTLLDGPDTGYSKKHFEQYIGFAPPASVSKIYYRDQSNMMDGRRQLRFVCSDAAILNRIIARQKLKATKSRNSTVGAKWWNIPHHNPNLQRFELDLGGWYTYLWFEPSTKTVWYETGDR